jgi:hypothetical protein
LEITVSRSRSGCVESLNKVALNYNTALNLTIGRLATSLPGLKIAYFDIYSGLLDLVKNPAANGKFDRSLCVDYIYLYDITSGT